MIEVPNPLPEHGNCPHCGFDLNGGGIWAHFFREFQTKGYWMDENGVYTKEKRILNEQEAAKVADEVASCYGATRERGRWGLKIGESVNDRVKWWHCPNCKGKWER